MPTSVAFQTDKWLSISPHNYNHETATRDGFRHRQFTKNDRCNLVKD